jgi:SAM-dependent methyltransferase
MKTFHDKWWSEGAIHEGHDFKWKWPVIKRILPTKNSTVLDFGCGDGRYIEEFLKINPYKILGADISPYAIREAKKKFPKANFHVVSEEKKLPFNNESIDFILAADVIEHLFDVPNFLSEMNRILKKSGKIFISTPYHGTIKNLIIALIGFDTAFNPTWAHIRFFTKKSLSDLLRKHGFDIVEYNQYGRFKPVSNGMYFVAKKVKSL